MRSKGPIFNATIRTTSVLSVRLVVQTGTLLIVAALLGADRFGAFAAICALAVVLGSLSSVGTHIRLLRDISRNKMFRDASVASSLGTTLAGGGVLFGLYTALCIFGFPNLTLSSWVIATIGLSEIVLQPFIMLIAAEHQAAHRIARSQMLLILPLALRLIAALIVWIAVDPQQALAAYTTAYLFIALLSLAIGFRTLESPWPPVSSWRLMKKHEWREGSGFALLGFSARGPTELDKILAVQLLALPAAGTYALASRIVGAATLPVTALMLSAMPSLFRAPTSPHQPKLTLTIFATSAAYGASAGAILYLCAPLGSGIFGPEYEGVDATLRHLSAAAPALSLRIAASNILMTTFGPWKRFGIELIGLCALPALAIAFSNILGNAALPAAYVATEILMAALGWLSIIFLTLQRRREHNTDV